MNSSNETRKCANLGEFGRIWAVECVLVGDALHARSSAMFVFIDWGIGHNI